jgi:hypothetical protein
MKANKKVIDAKDPKRNWVRKNYDENILDNITERERSELETIRDLDKTIEQLICDVHEETHNKNRTALENIAAAQKRMVSMLGRVAITNDAFSKRLNRLNWLMFFLAVLQTIIAVLTVTR